MNNQQQPVSEAPAVADEQILNDDELKTLAKFLDTLMEIDFEQQCDLRADDCFKSQPVRTSA
jgi:hypothetical protein